LVDLGAKVRVVGSGSIPDDLVEDAMVLKRLGAEIVSRCNLNAARYEYEVLFLDSYTSPRETFVLEARRRGKAVTTLADLLFQLSPARKLAVTGSAGKSTTTMLVGEMLAASGLSIYMPISDAYKKQTAENPYPNYELVQQLDQMSSCDWIVVELTSSHLEYMHVSPDVAVITTISPDHVEWHGSLEAYYEAKAVIMKHQSPDQWLIVNQDDELSQRLVSRYGRGQIMSFSLHRKVEPGVFVNDGRIIAAQGGEQVALAATSDVRIPHGYLANLLGASAAALAVGGNVEAIGSVIRTFKGLRQRLEFVGRVDGVAVFNDGLAATPRKAKAGLESFGDRSVILIAGGERRIEGYGSEGFLHSSPEERQRLRDVCRIAVRKCRRVVLVSDAGRDLEQVLDEEGYPSSHVTRVGTLRAASKEAVRVARNGDSILLSPLYYMDLEEIAGFNALIIEEAETAGRSVESPAMTGDGGEDSRKKASRDAEGLGKGPGETR